MSKAAKPKTPSTKSLNDEEVKRLLEYYRIRFDNIKEDRKEWLKNLEGVKMSSHTFHEQEWELRQLIDKIQEYQQTLSETNIALNNERKRNVTFMNEIENYKSKQNLPILHEKYSQNEGRPQKNAAAPSVHRPC